MKRRDFIAGVGGALAMPVAMHAQHAMPLLGFISPVARDLFSFAFPSFLKGLGETGYVEGRNVLIDYRSTEGRNDLLPAVLADLLRRQVSLIVVAGNSQIAAAKAATATVPIVFLTGEDPVKVGFVASLNRPGGNLTGVNTLALAVGPKRLEVMHELLPTATRIALLANPSNPISTENQTRELQAAARPHAIQLDVLLASSDREFDAVFASLLERRTDGLIILPDAFLNSRSEQLAHLALRHRVPAIFQGHQFVMAGGLMSYGTNSSEAFRLVGVYAGRVLKGEKPATLPILQSTKVELFVNLKTAKALGISVPLPLLGRADEVIE